MELNNAELSSLNSTQKTLTILKDVADLDIDAYNASFSSFTEGLYFDVLPEEDFKCTLTNSESKIEVICAFVNGNIRSMNAYVDGSPYMTKEAIDDVEMAKNFISKYKTLSNASYFDIMLPMLENIKVNQNVSKTVEKAKLEVTSTDDGTSFRWTYSLDNIEAPMKCVSLNFKNHFLKSFIDTWRLFSISDAEIKISEEEAVMQAMNCSKDFSWTVNMGENKSSVTVTEFNITDVGEKKLTFSNYATKNESRNSDPLTLYPNWRIKLYFDKIYQGQVYGIDVGIWADTGENYDIRTLKFLGSSTNDDTSAPQDTIASESNEDNTGKINLNIILIVLVTLLIAAMLGAVTVVYSKKRKSIAKLSNGQRVCSIKLGKLLSCFMVAALVFSIGAQTVNGSTYVMGLYGCTFQTESTEVDAAEAVVDVWEDFFESYGSYTCNDYFGSPTEKQTVLDNADSYEDNYDHVAMFHYGHAGMDGVQRDYFDDDGWEDPENFIWDYEIYQETSSSKHFFVILWSCRQGDYIGGTIMGTPYGMPYAWFHGAPSSGDCFIGFEDASMPLTQISRDNANVDYEPWLMSVGMRLAYCQDTVHQALDYASNYYFSRDYTETELDEEYTAYWSYGTWTGQMKIYGNWDIQVRQ